MTSAVQTPTPGATPARPTHTRPDKMVTMTKTMTVQQRVFIMFAAAAAYAALAGVISIALHLEHVWPGVIVVYLLAVLWGWSTFGPKENGTHQCT